MPYETSVAFSGDKVQVLEKAQELFAHRGFEVSDIMQSEFAATKNFPIGMGGKKTNDMLVLFSKVLVSVRGGEVSARGEMGTLKRLARFLFIPLSVATIGECAAIVALPDQRPFLIAISAATTWLWFVLGPAMLLLFRSMAFNELDTLIRNAVRLGGRS